VFVVKYRGLTPCLQRKLLILKVKEVARTLQVPVKWVDMQGNTKSESRPLGDS
jgi:hypothetical protein